MSAPLIETYHEGAVCPPYTRLYSSVFSLLQKPANVRVKSRIVNSNEFQSERLEVAKPRDPYLASRLCNIDLAMLFDFVIQNCIPSSLH